MKWWNKRGAKNRAATNRAEMTGQSNSELLQEVERILENGNDETMDTERLEAYLAELQKRAPVMEDFDQETEWKKTKEENFFLFELGPSEQPSTWRGFRKIRTAEIFIAVALCLVITVNAFGYNPARWFLDWVDDIIRISNAEPSGNLILPQDDGSEYHSLSEALDAYDINPDTGPQWIPADYSITSVNVQESDGLLKVTGIYTSDRGRLFIRVTQYKDGEDAPWIRSVERDAGGVEKEINGHQIYIVTNAGKTKSGWLSGPCFCEIAGHITEDEITQMIQSIQ